MRTETATDVKNQFGRVLDQVSKGPVVIQKSGRNVAVILSYEDYEHMVDLEDRYWLKKAEEAHQEGYVGTDESEKLLKDILSAED